MLIMKWEQDENLGTNKYKVLNRTDKTVLKDLSPLEVVSKFSSTRGMKLCFV